MIIDKSTIDENLEDRCQTNFLGLAWREIEAFKFEPIFFCFVLVDIELVSNLNQVAADIKSRQFVTNIYSFHFIFALPQIVDDCVVRLSTLLAVKN